MIRRASLCAVGLLMLAAAPAVAGDGWWGALDEGEAVSLADVMRGPQNYRGQLITFFCVFHTAEGAYKYYPPNTPFREQRHVNFSVWPDGTPLWAERAFKDDLPFLYLTRTHAQRAELLRMQAFTRLEITGKVRDVLRGQQERPAIEVFSFRVTGHRLGKAVVQEVMRGMNYARADTTLGYQLAARSFRDALKPDLPPTYDMMVRKLLADTLRRLGMHTEAAQYERGEGVGLPSLPERRPDEALPQPPTMPDDLPQPFQSSGPGGAPAPAQPVPYGDPDGAAPAGIPAPVVVRPGSDLRGPPAGAPPSPFASDDLPGRPRPDPVAPPTGRPGTPGVAPSDLPPAAPSARDGVLPPPAGAARPRVPPVPPPPAAVQAPVVPPPSQGARSGIPPKRRTRLSGVR